jgi:hypothetical protein
MPRSYDRADFARLANRRVPAAIKSIELVGNLANTSNYVFTKADAEAVLKALRVALDECAARYAGKKVLTNGFRLPD